MTTPTPEQLAAVLPRCQAGLEGGDWSEDDERLKWATRALHYVGLAIEAERKVAMAQALNAPEPADEAFEITKALKACHAMQNPQPEFRTAVDPHWHFGDDPYCEDCRPLNDEEAIARGDRTAHMSARLVEEWDPMFKYMLTDGTCCWEVDGKERMVYWADVPVEVRSRVDRRFWPPPTGRPAENAVCPTCPILQDMIPASEVKRRLAELAQRSSEQQILDHLAWIENPAVDWSRSR